MPGSWRAPRTQAEATSGPDTGDTIRSGGTSPDWASTPNARRSSSSNPRSGGGPRRTVTTQSSQAGPRTRQVSQSMCTLMGVLRRQPSVDGDAARRLRQFLQLTYDRFRDETDDSSYRRIDMTTTQLRTTGDDAPGAAADPAPDGTHHVVLRTSVRTLLFTLAWACTCNVTLEVLQGGSFARPVLLLLGAVVLWSLLLLAVALSGRLWIPCTLLLVSALGLGIANAMKLHLREEPVYPSDLAFATSPGFLAQMVSPVNLVAIILVIAALGAAVVVAGRLAAR